MPINQTLQSGLNSLDLFGKSSSSAFYVRGKKQVFSYPGLILSLAIMTFLIVVTIIFFLNLVNRHSPFVSQSDLKGVIDQEPLYLNTGTNSSFNFLIQFEQGGANWRNDPSYYDVRAYYIRPSGPNSYIKMQAEIEECFSEALNRSGFCLSPTPPMSNESILVLGHDNTVHHIVVIEVWPCDNVTSGNICASSEDIDARMGETLIWFHYNDWSVDSRNFENPMTPYTRTFKMHLAQYLTKYLRADLMEIEFTSDDSYFFESNRTEKVVTLESSTFDSGDRLYYEDMYAEITIYSSGNKIAYNRKYKKIQDVLAELTGLASIIIPIIAFLVLPYVDIKMRESLVNECFCVITTNGSDPQQERKTGLNTSNSRNKSQKKGFKKDDSDRQTKERSVSPNRKYSRIDSRAALIPVPLPDLESLKQSNEEGSKKSSSDPIIMTLPDNPENNNNTKQNQNQNQNTELELCPLKPFVITSRQEQTDDIILDPHSIAVHSESNQIVYHKTSEKPKTHGIPSSLGDLEATEHNLQADMEPKGELENRLHQEVSPNPNSVVVHKNKHKHKKKRIGISFIRWIFSCCRHHPESKILRKAESKLLAELDLVTMCKKISEIDKLKACLLTREQRILFDSLSMPLILYDPSADIKSEDAIMIENWYELGKVSEDDVKVAYSMLKECDTGSEADKKLISIYEQRVHCGYLSST